MLSQEQDFSISVSHLCFLHMYLSQFHLSLMNISVINLGEQISLQHSDFIPFECTLESRIASYHGVSIYNCLRRCDFVVHNGLANLHPQNGM